MNIEKKANEAIRAQRTNNLYLHLHVVKMGKTVRSTVVVVVIGIEGRQCGHCSSDCKALALPDW